MKKTLAELADIYYGKSPSEIRTEYSLIPIYGTGGLVGWASKPLFDKSGIIVGRKGTLGRPILSENPFWAIDTTYAVIPKERVNIKWLYYNLLKYDLTRLNEATGVPSINRDLLSSIGLEYFPENQQAEIANVLCAVDNALEKNESLLSKLTDLKKALMQELFFKGIGHKEFKDSPLGRIPKTWNLNILNNVIKIIDCKHITPKFVDEGYPFIRPRNVKLEGLDFSDIDHISENDFTVLTDKHKPKKGDIIFSRNATFGIPSYNDTDVDFAIGQDVVVMTETDLPSKYIFFFLQSEIAKQQIVKVSTGSTFNRINLEFIRKLQVFVPPMAEQEKIINVFDSLEKRIKGIRAKIDSFLKLKQALMKDLLSGKVRVKLESQELAGVNK